MGVDRPNLKQVVQVPDRDPVEDGYQGSINRERGADQRRDVHVVEEESVPSRAAEINAERLSITEKFV